METVVNLGAAVAAAAAKAQQSYTSPPNEGTLVCDGNSKANIQTVFGHHFVFFFVCVNLHKLNNRVVVLLLHFKYVKRKNSFQCGFKKHDYHITDIFGL